MITLEERGNALLRKVWGDLQAASRQREIADAKANPEKHRLSRIILEGGTNYTYWPGACRYHGKRRREQTWFCVAHHRNAAGVFLLWREVGRYRLKGKKWGWYETERFDHQWGPNKVELRGIAKAKAERDKAEHAIDAAMRLPNAPAEAQAMLAASIG